MTSIEAETLAALAIAIPLGIIGAVIAIALIWLATRQ